MLIRIVVCLFTSTLDVGAYIKVSLCKCIATHTIKLRYKVRLLSRESLTEVASYDDLRMGSLNNGLVITCDLTVLMMLSVVVVLLLVHFISDTDLSFDGSLPILGVYCGDKIRSQSPNFSEVAIQDHPCDGLSSFLNQNQRV
jgi:hypothetical protein